MNGIQRNIVAYGLNRFSIDDFTINGWTGTLNLLFY